MKLQKLENSWKTLHLKTEKDALLEALNRCEDVADKEKLLMLIKEKESQIESIEATPSNLH